MITTLLAIYCIISTIVIITLVDALKSAHVSAQQVVEEARLLEAKVINLQKLDAGKQYTINAFKKALQSVEALANIEETKFKQTATNLVSSVLKLHNGN